MPAPPDADGRSATVALVVNVRARLGEDAFHEARELLAQRGVALCAARAVEDPASLGDAVDAALAAGATTLVVGGGDGTVSTVATRIAYREIRLGVFPLGTANSFARSLGIPRELPAAADVIATGHSAPVDLGRIGERYFANSCAIGLAARIASGEIDELKRRFGRAGYLLGGAREFLRHRGFSTRLVADGVEHRHRALEIVIANGRYHGGLLVTYLADPRDHGLVARVVLGERPWQLARAWLRSGSGRPAKHEQVELVRFERLRIEASPRQPVTVDGEAVAHTPVDVEVAAGALRVLVPPGAQPG